jgi:hypothetical protein
MQSRAMQRIWLSRPHASSTNLSMIPRHPRAAGVRITLPAPAASGATEWIGAGNAPHHRLTSCAGVHDHRIGAGFLTAAIPPIVNSDILPFDLPLHGLLGGVLGVGIGACLVTAALAGRDGVVDLARRSTRWRLPVRWYLVTLFTVPIGATPTSLLSTVRQRSPHQLMAGIEGWLRWPRSSYSS